MPNAIWRGCHLSAPHADYFHDAHDFADYTFCGLSLARVGILSEGNVTSAMRECPTCAKVAAQHTAHGMPGCAICTEHVRFMLRTF
jgi:hypothetical protein